MDFCSSINDLPASIISDILSRLPTKTIIGCKSICKSWRNLLLEPYFANLHLSRSPTSLIIHQKGSYIPESDSDIVNLLEFQDESDGQNLRYDPVMKFDLRICYPDGQILLVGSVNGLLCFCDYTNECLFICNPTVRQYVTVPEPKHKTRYPSMIVYGFGFSSISGQYKLVQIYQKALSDPALGNCSYENLGEVYTLGTGKWRSIGTVPFGYDLRLYSVTLNGNIHWLICDMECPYSICAFDIENESFRGFSYVPGLSRGTLYKSLGLLEGRLCVCDNSSNSDLVIRVMKEYGVSESWTKEIVIRLESDLTCLLYAQVTPIKVWRNGDILMLWRDDFLCSYNPERNSLEQVVVPRESAHIVDRFIIYEMMLHVASFCSLKDFAMEKVDMF
ncbi:F-box protein At3g07870-like [Rhododendron vialii]|uniref:F-box protein At3g07870-like n=1 Tax=Rhododendron vialii TaxID=182163 RepID=UPI00265FD199|nr:F-box protein At3g07870-like [Rhododendron vialii]